MSDIPKKKLYDFLEQIERQQPSAEETVAVFKDLFVEYFCGKRILESQEEILQNLEQELALWAVSSNPAVTKIGLIKRVREVTMLGLADAKMFTESYLTGGQNEKNPGTFRPPGMVIQNCKVAEFDPNVVKLVLNLVAKDFRVPPPFPEVNS